MHASRCFHIALYIITYCVSRFYQFKSSIKIISAYFRLLLYILFIWECIEHQYLSEIFRKGDGIKWMYSLLLYNNEYYTRKSFITKFSLSKLKAMMTSKQQQQHRMLLLVLNDNLFVFASGMW